MVFGFFLRRTPAVPVAGPTDDQATAPEDAPAAVNMEITESTQSESNRSDFEAPAPSTSSRGTAVPVQRTQSKSAFAFWKEKEQKLHSSAASVDAVATPPPATPTPSVPEFVTDPRALYALVSSVPAQTLRSYCLAHLNPANYPLPPSPKSRKRKGASHRRTQSAASQVDDELQSPAIDPLSPETLTTLTHFFQTLLPPPQLHCVRCHKGYFELENTDTSCRVPHDDESAIVDRVKSGDATYETLWGCCGRTVEGDGDQGPPDGWCYEGQHTIDTRRARFREDSTIYDDKLTSCAKLRCFGPQVSRPDSDGESVDVVRTKRKRRKSMAVDGEQGEGDDAKSATSEVKRRKRNTKKVQEEDEDEDAKSVASEPKKRRTRTRKAPISPEEVNTEDDMEVDEPQPLAPATPASPKRGRGRPSTKPRSRSVKPRSKAGEASPSPAAASGSALVEVRRSSRSPARPHATPGSKLKQQLSLASLKEASAGKSAKPESSRSTKRKTRAAAEEEEEEEEEETQKPAPVPAKTPKKRGRPRKTLQEVVDSSVAAEHDIITAV